MTWKAVARKDFHDSLRSRWFWVISAIFVGLFIGSAYFVGQGLGNIDEQVSSDAFLGLLGGQVVALLVPLIALVVAYNAIVGERESGTIKLMLSLPHSRQDVVVGKLLGRSGVIAVPILLGMVAAAIALVVFGINLKIVSYLLFTVLTIALGVTFVSLAIGISAAASTNRRAMVASVALYVVFTQFWMYARRVVLVLNDKLSLELETVEVVKYGLFIKYFNPVRAYETLVESLYANSTLGARLYGAGQFGPILEQQIGSVPFYLSNPVVIAQFLLWLLVPVAVGYLLFDRAEL
ncbi:ABC transporter permease [Haladaptatus pallidirubidus]|uniref:ABC-2 type transport system permease protein n=1 Tax=Haladaptatus pallidirubidus TaxID=1008152 RepID=A0AAV3UFQ7_9EURY|nr:ABC transporter permease [Haladaptatus pallidirubidus]